MPDDVGANCVPSLIRERRRGFFVKANGLKVVKKVVTRQEVAGPGLGVVRTTTIDAAPNWHA